MRRLKLFHGTLDTEFCNHTGTGSMSRTHACQALTGAPWGRTGCLGCTVSADHPLSSMLGPHPGQPQSAQSAGLHCVKVMVWQQEMCKLQLCFSLYLCCNETECVRCVKDSEDARLSRAHSDVIWKASVQAAIKDPAIWSHSHIMRRDLKHVASLAPCRTRVHCAKHSTWHIHLPSLTAQAAARIRLLMVGLQVNVRPW